MKEKNKPETRIISRNTTPLCFMPDGRLLCYHRGDILVFREDYIEKRIPIRVSILERYFGWNRWVTRLLRFGVRTVEVLDNEHINICIGNRLHELDLNEGRMTPGWFCGDGIRPLVMSTIRGIEGFADGVYFGGYLLNMDKNPVHIYRRTGVDHWEIVYTFKKGLINHVHNIIPDPYRNCLWVFTGDFGEASAIWKITDGFKKVERVVCGDQKWRADVVFVLPEGLLYATDAPFEDNFLYLLSVETMNARIIQPINGSCIYGCHWNNNFVFSTTVEGDGRKLGKWEFLFGRKRGAGIIDNYVHMYIGNIKEGFKEVYKESKDWFPFYTFQFGVFKFPVGANCGDSLYFQPVATKNNDLKLLAIK